MASSMPIRRLAGKNLISGNIFLPIRSVSAAPSVTRSFNTNAQMTRLDDDEHDDRSHRDVARRGREFPGFFSEVFDPFAPTRSVNQLMNIMDQIMESPLVSAQRGVGGMRRGWDVREDDEALHLKVDMPGLGKEDVKVSVEENTLVIKGEGEKESEEEEAGRRYSSRIELTPNMYKVDGIKAEMKNGVLKVVVPKVKEEDRRDVFQVQIQ